MNYPWATRCSAAWQRACFGTSKTCALSSPAGSQVESERNAPSYALSKSDLVDLLRDLIIEPCTLGRVARLVGGSKVACHVVTTSG